MRRPAVWLAAAWLLGQAVAAEVAPAAEAPAGIAAARAPSIHDSPGWYPPADPESASVRLGRRLGAPAVRLELRSGLRSLDAVGRAFCWALRHDRPDTLLRLCVTEEEFSRILWREFPQSRPATGLRAMDAWTMLWPRNSSGIRGAVADAGGRPLEFVRFERRDTTARYRNFKLHNGLLLVARNESGTEERFDVLRSVVERNGRFKIYSMRD
jgi:hypothetical protein